MRAQIIVIKDRAVRKVASAILSAICLRRFAFLLERRERWGLLWWLFLQRFCYRQVMYYVIIKSVATAARGTLVGWGKLERKATVNAEA
jgi:hypothetical protein